MNRFDFCVVGIAVLAAFCVTDSATVAEHANPGGKNAAGADANVLHKPAGFGDGRQPETWLSPTAAAARAG